MSIGLRNQAQQADHLDLNVQITTHTIQFFTLVNPVFCGLAASMSEAFLAYTFIDLSMFSLCRHSD